MIPKLLIDMNLSPEWVEEFRRCGMEACHWSEVGDPRAEDTQIMRWARERGMIVFTHDLDFGTALALTHAQGPSVLQVRGRHVLPSQISARVVAAIRLYQEHLNSGALVVIDEATARVRLLPI